MPLQKSPLADADPRFVAETYAHLVERLAPALFHRHGHVPDEENVAGIEALASLSHLHTAHKLPPFGPADPARDEASRLFRRRLLWRIQKQAGPWRERWLPLSSLTEAGWDTAEVRVDRQPERRALLNETVRRIERTLSTAGASPDEIALYFDYEVGALGLDAYARALGIPPGTAKQRACRMRRRLRERLSEAAPHYFWISRRGRRTSLNRPRSARLRLIKHIRARRCLRIFYANNRRYC